MPELVPMRLAGGNKAMSRKVAITKSILDGLRCPPGRRDVHLYDSKVHGLAFRLTANGARSWYLVRRIHGRAHRLKLRDVVTVEQARDAATKENAEIAKGGNPATERQTVRQSATIKELWDAYLDKHLTPRSTPQTIRTDTNRYDTCLASWATRKALSVTDNDVRAFHRQLGADRGHTSANRAMQLLRRMYNWSRLGTNPVTQKSIDWFHESERERFVQPDELPKLFTALNDEQTNPLIRDFLYMALFTGARRSNVAAMREDEINLATGTWTVPAGKSKNKKAMAIPLSPPAMKIVKDRIAANAAKESLPEHSRGFIFPSDGKTGHLVEPKATWAAVLLRAGLKDLHLHDLRRTLGSWQAAAGSSLAVIGASLGHQDTQTTKIYARLNLDPVRASVGLATDAMLAAAREEKPKTAKKTKGKTKAKK